MTAKERSIWSSTVVASLAGLGVCYLVAKYHTRILKRIRLVLDYRNPLRHQTIEIINNVEDCNRVVNKFKLQCVEFNVIGFDCEWVTVGGTRRPIALLQLATHNGLCALFRLNVLKTIPPELRELLEDDNIVKVGVGPYGDANYLAKDYGVCVGSTFDLRYLAVMARSEPCGLGKMSLDTLNVKLDKDWRIRCSNWEANILSQRQVNYAAKDAHVAVEIFKVFAQKIAPQSTWSNRYGYVRVVLDRCFGFLDLQYNAVKLQINRSNVGQNKGASKKLSLNKAQTRNISTRAKPLYHNCYLEAPDGDVLCTCARKKAEWYVHRELGTVVSDDPYTVRLKFEPSGRAVGDVGKYYQTAKVNQCVVCGENNSYIRKNIIPREYRRFFPFVMKDHTSHDVLLLCPKCHQLSNLADLGVRSRLANECDAPFTHAEGGSKSIENPRLQTLRSTARALYLLKDKIPAHRIEELRNTFLSLHPKNTEITDDLLKEYIDIDTAEQNEHYCAHGSKVVDFYKNKEGGLTSLERMWRQHFLTVMQPKYLPELWSVEHNVYRLEIRADEGRIENKDLQLAGLTANKLILDENEKRYDSDNSDSLMSQPSSRNQSFDEDDFQIEDYPEREQLHDL